MCRNQICFFTHRDSTVMSGSKYLTYSDLMPIFLNNQRYLSGPFKHHLSYLVETSLEVQWLRLCASNAEGMNSIPGWRIKIPHTMQHGQKKYKVT